MAPNIINRYVSEEDTARAQLPVCRSDSKTNRIGRLLPRKPSHLIPAGKPRGGLVLTLQRASPQGGRASILKRVPKRDMEGAAACHRSHRTTVLGAAAITGPSCSGHAHPPPETRAVANRAYGNGNQVPRQGVRKSQAPQLDSRVACTPSTGLRHWTQTSQK